MFLKNSGQARVIFLFFLAPRFIFSLAQSYGANPYFCARLPEPHVNSTTLNSCIIVNRFTKYSKILAPVGILGEPFYNIFQNVGPCGHIRGTLLQHIPKIWPLRAY